MTELAAQLKAAREARGQTQEQAAHEVRVSFTTWSRWENGHHTPQGLYRKAAERYIRKAKEA